MNRNTVTVLHDLCFVSVDDLDNFFRIGALVRMTFRSVLTIPSVIPGSIRMSVNRDNSLSTKKITFECVPASPAAADLLRRMCIMRLVAVYSDDRHRRRVCGSPDFPIGLEMSETNGVFSCTATASDADFDCFISD